MKNQDLSTRIKSLRIAKGYSQDYLASQTQLSLRTIQRIENGESEPRGDSLQRLSACLGIDVSELTSAANNYPEVDSNYLTIIHLSALSFIVFPLFGILVPYIMAIRYGKQFKEVNYTVKRVVNFQITWCIIFVAYNALMISSAILHYYNPLMELPDLIVFLFIPAMYAYNILFTCFNAAREYNKKSVFYQPALPLLR
ncbi:helix-turn-helix domain-containing protein [uncultured Mucilaginibacter sp.]|uniref:helix-turn-helix domain-containing protein n=1 Tax=uncultured Mucilaginibacter sp. TaxID=797541 RepID=UPI0025EBB1EB|nr:helix-turn-helix domain-containing protein [uncultured Mucilaginibacter sp.]